MLSTNDSKGLKGSEPMRFKKDVTNTLIEDFYSDQPNDYCGNPSNNWIYWIVVDDYDNDGNLDIYNKMMSNRPLHRWEWNLSLIHISEPTRPY